MITSLTPFPVLLPTYPMSPLTPSQFDSLFICISIWKYSLLCPFGVAYAHMISGLTTLYWITNRGLIHRSPFSTVIIVYSSLSRVRSCDISPPALAHLLILSLFRVCFIWAAILLRCHGVAFLSFLGDTVSQQIFWSSGSYNLSRPSSMMFPNP